MEVAELKIFIRTDDDGQDWKRVHQRDSSWSSAWSQSAEEGQLLKMELPGTRRKEEKEDMLGSVLQRRMLGTR